MWTRSATQIMQMLQGQELEQEKQRQLDARPLQLVRKRMNRWRYKSAEQLEKESPSRLAGLPPHKESQWRREVMYMLQKVLFCCPVDITCCTTTNSFAFHPQAGMSLKMCVLALQPPLIE